MSTTPGPNGTRSVTQVIGAVRRQVEQLTGRPVESVTSVRPEGDGWTVELELVELERIPASTSVLGSYRVSVEGDGTLTGYERTHRYYRNQAGEDQL